MPSARRSTTRKREADDEGVKANPDDDVKGETLKDEDSNAESDGEGKWKEMVAGEEADVRDVIYNLEKLCESILNHQKVDNVGSHVNLSPDLEVHNNHLKNHEYMETYGGKKRDRLFFFEERLRL